METRKLSVSSTPHIRSKHTIESVMLDVIIALAPALLCGLYFFGIRALLIIALSVGSCLLGEFCFNTITKRTQTIGDLSAVITGLLLAFSLPVATPLYIPIVGGLFAMVVVKMIFGGLGQNFVNPALAGRAFLLASYPVAMTTWTEPVNNMFGTDAVTSATPIALINESATEFVLSSGDFTRALFGNVSGSIGETSAIAIIIGGAYLLLRHVITWRIPVAYLGSFFIMALFNRGFAFDMAAYELLLGSVLLAAFFMATDYTTSPMSPKGQLVFGIGCGVLTYTIRTWGAFPEGVTYAILLMNLTVPLIDRYMKPKVFGKAKQAEVA